MEAGEERFALCGEALFARGVADVDEAECTVGASIRETFDVADLSTAERAGAVVEHRQRVG
jgi:hypothetical protein